MNFKDFEIARKKRKTEESHKAIVVKHIKDRQSRPRAKENYFAKNNPKMQGI